MTAFEAHRMGVHGVSRRCRTIDEMQLRGMLINNDGFWIKEQRNDIPNMDTRTFKQSVAHHSKTSKVGR